MIRYIYLEVKALCSEAGRGILPLSCPDLGLAPAFSGINHPLNSQCPRSKDDSDRGDSSSHLWRCGILYDLLPVFYSPDDPVKQMRRPGLSGLKMGPMSHRCSEATPSGPQSGCSALQCSLLWPHWLVYFKDSKSPCVRWDEHEREGFSGLPAVVRKHGA